MVTGYTCRDGVRVGYFQNRSETVVRVHLNNELFKMRNRFPKSTWTLEIPKS